MGFTPNAIKAMKVVGGLAVLGGLSYYLYTHKDSFGVSGGKSVKLDKIDLPTAPANAAATVKPLALPSSNPVSVVGPQIRHGHWAWNTHMGMWLASGGKTPTSGSLFSKYGVNYWADRQDMVDQMQAGLVSWAEAAKTNPNPSVGYNMVTIMGDGAAAFLEGVNPKLAKIGAKAVIVGSLGFSSGEDKFMGPAEWRTNPKAAKGAVCAAYLRDGDWNIAVKWAFDNDIPVNPDEKTYDADALNFYNPADYMDAARKYVEGYKETRDVVVKGIKTGKTKEVTINSVATWTPGDVMVARKKGGLVNIASTKEYAAQMPNVVIVVDTFLKANRPTVKNFLKASFEGADQVKSYSAALRRAAEISSVAYNEKGEDGRVLDANYWETFYKGTTEQDKQGLMVELGGSKVNNLADNLALFGLNGGTNTFEVVYKVFGDVVVKLYPKLMPTYPKCSDILDLSLLRELKEETPASTLATADTQTYNSGSMTQKVSEKAYTIEFASGSATLSPKSIATLKEIAQNAIVASGLSLRAIGHTDNAGNPEGNRTLSAARAASVGNWLKANYPDLFPASRIATEGRGQDEPVADNSTAEGKARNRRVVIVMGR